MSKKEIKETLLGWAFIGGAIFLTMDLLPILINMWRLG